MPASRTCSKESGLYYLQSRYYDPEVGRFLNADTFASTGQGILGYNMYAYCCNNPLAYIDYTGYLPIDPSGDLGGWLGEMLGNLLVGWIEDTFGSSLHNIGSALLENISGSVSVGLGHYAEIGILEDVVSVSGGCKYDLCSLSYSDGEWVISEQFYSGAEISVIGLFDAGNSIDQYRAYGASVWKDSATLNVYEVVGGGLYFFAGGSFSIVINLDGFYSDLFDN